jgi:tripeptidyl-peptidase-1
VKPEVAADLSGGGFSNYFTRPFYQDAAVSTYLKSVGTTYSGLYKCVFLALTWEIPRDSRVLSSSGRGYPDISAQALNFQVVFNRVVRNVEGTSCAAPVRFTTMIPRSSTLTHRHRLQQASFPS